MKKFFFFVFIVFLQTFLLSPFLSKSQTKKNSFSNLEEFYNSFVNQEVSDSDREIIKKTLLDENKFNQEEEVMFVRILNTIDIKNNSELLNLVNYINWASENLNESTKLEDLLTYHLSLIVREEFKSKNYFTSLWRIIKTETVYSDVSYKLIIKKDPKIGLEDFLGFSLYNNFGDVQGTLTFYYSSVDLIVDSEFHNFEIKKTDISLYPDINVIQGKNGLISSKINNPYISDLGFFLNKFSLDLTQGVLVSDETTLNTTTTKKVEGSLEYRVLKNSPLNSNNFNFISNNSNIHLIQNNNYSLTSGLFINGDKVFTKSKSNGFSEFLLQLGFNKKISVKSKSFFIDHQDISAEKSTFKLFDVSDSVYHSQVEFNFNFNSEKIELFNTKGLLSNSAFYSSYFNIEFDADYLSYTLGGSEVFFKMIVAPTQRPLSVYSRNYFAQNKINEMTDLNGINFLKAVYTYFSKIKREDFYIADFAYSFNLNVNLIEGGIIDLWRNGFVLYDKEIGLIEVLPKLKHYYLSHSKRSDYDEVSFTSLSPTSNNLIYNLKSDKMLFDGVENLRLSEKNNLIVYPQSGMVELKKNREINTIGNLSVGNFDFRGVTLSFKYDAYKIDLLKIDTLKMITKVNNLESYNYLYNIGGGLFINHPKNKSSLRKLPNFPFFVSDKSTSVYFEMPDDYGSKYDSSFYFTIDQFRIDSLDKSTLPKFEFPGKFYSVGIFNPLEAKLITMPDNSFGFTIDLKNNNLDAYGKNIQVFENLMMDSTGLYSEGNIKYNSTTLFSEKFRFFPDSISGYVEKGFMSVETSKKQNFIYPELELSNLQLTYLKDDNNVLLLFDSLKRSEIINKKNNYKIFGDLTISSTEVSSEGKIKIGDSYFFSDRFVFEESLIASDYADAFLKEKSQNNDLVNAEGVKLKYKINEKELNLKTTLFGQNNFMFPRFQLFSSFAEINWNIQQKSISVTSEDNSEKTIYSLSPEFNSWSFDASMGLIDVKENLFLIKGVEEIVVADAYIIPYNKELSIRENLKIDPLLKSSLVLDTLEENHKFVDSDILILTKDKFEGKGIYEYVNFNLDTFNVPFSNFEIKSDTDGRLTTYSKGSVDKNDPVLMEPGFNFYGTINLYANSDKLFFDGFIIPSEVNNFNPDNAISFKEYFAPGDELQLSINDNQDVYSSAISLNEEGLFFDFFNNPVKNKNSVFFNPEGSLSYDSYSNEYLIEKKEKRNLEDYEGNSLLYNPSSNSVSFEGETNLFDNDKNFKILSSMQGKLNLDSLEVESDAFLIIDINVKRSIIDELGFAFTDIIETFGAPIAHDNEQEVLMRMSDLIGNEKTIAFENLVLSKYESLIEADELLNTTFVITNTKFSWSPTQKSWYNTATINLSNIGSRDINASVDGFLEIKRSNNHYVFSMFLQPAPELWVYFKYDGDYLWAISSSERINKELSDLSGGRDRYISSKITNEEEVLSFINAFRFNHFGIKEQYNLLSPSDTFLEDEIFKTISEDDGF